jgi:hypothetical protein
LDVVVLLRFQDLSSCRFDELPQLLAAHLYLRRTLQRCGRSEETGSRQVHARSHLDNTRRHRIAIAINDLVGRRNASDALSIPPAPKDFNLAIDGEN